jgi:hypothetical protein
MKLVGAGAALALAAEGCGAATEIGDVGDFNGNLGGSANSVIGQNFGGEQNLAGEQNFGGSVTAACGDGQIEPGEECDGNNFGVATCASITDGAEPLGFLLCAENCQIDTENCASAGTGGNFGTGGSFGTGGNFGAGGFGTGGFFAPDASVGSGGSAAICYAAGGVPDRSNIGACDFGAPATEACYLDYQSTGGNIGSEPPTCGAFCGCQNCVSSYDQCTALAGCLDHLNCIEESCGGNLPCVPCNGYLQGASQYTYAVVDAVLSCLGSAGCAPACITSFR